jgi:hypothetical protein
VRLAPQALQACQVQQEQLVLERLELQDYAVLPELRDQQVFRAIKEQLEVKARLA